MNNINYCHVKKTNHVQTDRQTEQKTDRVNYRRASRLKIIQRYIYKVIQILDKNIRALIGQFQRQTLDLIDRKILN